MTGIIADSMYEFFVDNDALPVEQKGCRRKSRGTKDQLLIDKMVLVDCKRKHKNLAMAYGWTIRKHTIWCLTLGLLKA